VVPVRDARGIVPQVVRRLDAVGIAIDDVGVRHSTLDDVIFALTGHGADDGDGTGADELAVEGANAVGRARS
jgi:oleandomycin transport system ATP-binding protein